METVYVVGVFDLFHRGHVELLRKARDLGDRLIVAINGDEMTARYKRRPLYPEGDRLEIVRACRFVDEAFVIEEFDNRPQILKYGVTKVVHGDDWDPDSYMAQIRVTPEFALKHGVTFVYLPYWRGTSTSQIIKMLSDPS